MNGSSVDRISCFQAWRVGYGIGGSIELNGRIVKCDFMKFSVLESERNRGW